MKNKCYIIAGGNSVTDIDKSKLEDGDIIVVNKAILDFPNAKYFVTLDHSFLKKLDLKKKVLKESPAVKVFIANLHPEYMDEKDGAIVDTRWNIRYSLKLFDMIIKSREKEGLGLEWDDFRNGYNSGYCAIQLAILLGYKEINLIGYDFMAFKTTHYHDGYAGQTVEKFNETLEEYFKTLKNALLDFKKLDTGIKMYNCSAMSKLEDILTYKEL